MVGQVALRFLRTLIVLLGVSLLVFISIRLVPGDPAILFAGERATDEQTQATREHLGLDQPIAAQYGAFVADAVRRD